MRPTQQRLLHFVLSLETNFLCICMQMLQKYCILNIWKGRQGRDEAWITNIFELHTPLDYEQIWACWPPYPLDYKQIWACWPSYPSGLWTDLSLLTPIPHPYPPGLRTRRLLGRLEIKTGWTLHAWEHTQTRLRDCTTGSTSTMGLAIPLIIWLSPHYHSQSSVFSLSLICSFCTCIYNL